MSSEHRLYCVSDGTHCSADVCCVGFSGSRGHTFTRADAARDLAKRQLVQRLYDEILHVRSRLDDPPGARGIDQNGRVTFFFFFFSKLFGTEPEGFSPTGFTQSLRWFERQRHATSGQPGTDSAKNDFQLDSVRCSPSLPRDMDAFARVNTDVIVL